jgi:hypothetical protein
MSFPNREELLLRAVFALPNASSTGLEDSTLSTMRELAVSLSLACSAAVVARKRSTIFVVSATTWTDVTSERFRYIMTAGRGVKLYQQPIQAINATSPGDTNDDDNNKSNSSCPALGA